MGRMRFRSLIKFLDKIEGLNNKLLAGLMAELLAACLIVPWGKFP